MGSFLATLAWGAPPTPPGPQLSDVELDAEKQLVIWDAEHVAFKIERHFGVGLFEALAAGDPQRLVALARDDFSGHVFKGKPRSRRVAQITETQHSAELNSKLEAADASAVLGHMQQLYRRFAFLERSGLRVLKLRQLGEKPQRWETQLLVSLAGRDANGQPLEVDAKYDALFVVANPEAITRGATILSQLSATSESIRSGDQLLFEEVTARRGLDRLSIADNWKLPPPLVREFRFQTAVDDFDGDGRLDIAIGTLEGIPYLLRSKDGRKFENVATPLGLKRGERFPKPILKHTLTGWIDFDNDGDPDLLMGSRLYRNDAGKKFVDITANSGLSIERVPLGVVVFDYDLDGRLDLYIVYLKDDARRSRMPNRPWVGDVESGGKNALWRNLGEGRFKNVTRETNAGGGPQQSFAASALFFNDDAHPDIYIANDFGTNVLLVSNGDGTFRDATADTGIGDFSTSMGVVTGHLDSDDQPEIYVANMYSKMGRRIISFVGPEDYPAGVYPQIRGSCAGNRLYAAQSDGTFAERGDDAGVSNVGWAYAPTMIDVDGDGLNDLYATTGFMSADRDEPDG